MIIKPGARSKHLPGLRAQDIRPFLHLRSSGGGL